MAKRGRTVAAVLLAALPLVATGQALGAVKSPPAGLAVSASGRSLVPGASNNIDGKPNVILFLTDDQTLGDMKVLGSVRRRIGDPGTTFRRAFSQYPLCCPARATILTGQHAHNHGVMGNRTPEGGFEKFADQETLPVWLRRAGYNTVMLGKYLNGYDGTARRYVPPGWTDWQVPVHGAYNFRAFTMNENGTLKSYREYQTDHWSRRGTSLIKKYAPRVKPFFLWQGFLAPHTGGPVEPGDPIKVSGDKRALPTPAVTSEYRDTFRGLALPSKPSILEADMSDKPSMTARRSRPRWEFREAYQQRLESLLSVNKAINTMLDTLEATGEAGNTLLIFASDNGHLVGEHRGFGKIVGYEESARVPLMLKGPGITSGVRRDQLVSLTDLTSTIAVAAGATPTLLQDGRPLQDFSAGPTVGAKRPMLLEAGPNALTNGRRLYTGIRTPEGQSLLRWYTGDTEYYDLSEDPFQLDGTLSGTERQEDHDALLARLDVLQNCSGASCQ